MQEISPSMRLLRIAAKILSVSIAIAGNKEKTRTIASAVSGARGTESYVIQGVYQIVAKSESLILRSRLIKGNPR